MNTFDFTPLYRSSVGFDHLASMINTVSRHEGNQSSYPPYNIQVLNDESYRITMAVAGFSENDIDIISESNSLIISGQQKVNADAEFLYQGIAARDFERKFKLADHVKVVAASIENGLLQIDLQRELPEAMKPKKIKIQKGLLGMIKEKLN